MKLRQDLEQVTAKLKSTEEYKNQIQSLSGEYQNILKSFEEKNIKELRCSADNEFQLRQKIHNLNAQVAELKGKIIDQEKLRNELEELKRRHEDYKRSHKKIEEQLKSQIEEIETGKSMIDTRLAEMSKKIKDTEKENIKLRAQCKENERRYREKVDQHMLTIGEKENCIINNNLIDIKELKDENKNVKSLSQQIKECYKKIETISKEIVKEKENNDKLMKEKEQLEQELDIMKYRIVGDNSPRTLKKMNKQLTNDIELLETEKAELSKTNTILIEQTNAAITLLSILQKSTLEIDQDEYKRSVEKIKEPGLLREMKGMFLVIDQLNDKVRNLSIQNERLKNEFRATEKLKETIMVEINEFKDKLVEQSENTRTQEEEFILTKQALDKLQSEKEEQKLLFDKTFSSLCKRLEEVLLKFSETECVKRNINLKPSIDYLHNPISASNELVTIVNDLTNVLNFEIKARSIMNSKLEENMKQLQEEKTNLEDLFNRLSEEKNELRIQYEEMNESINELTITSDKYKLISTAFAQVIITNSHIIPELIQQKNLLLHQYNSVVNNLNELNNQLHQFKQTPLPQVLSIMKFRKAAISIIAFNRFLKLKKKIPIEEKAKMALQDLLDNNSVSDLQIPSYIIKTILPKSIIPDTLLDKLNNGLQSIKYKSIKAPRNTLISIEETIGEFITLNKRLQNDNSILLERLSILNAESEKYSINIKRMGSVIDELNSKSISSKDYKYTLEQKNKEIEYLNNTNVVSKYDN